MNISDQNPLDERIIATYPSKDKINQAYVILRRKLGLTGRTMKIIPPKHQNVSESLEGKSKPIGESMLSAHILYSMIGLLVGIFVAILLVNFGPALFSNSPVFTFIGLVSPGIFIGSFYAGIRSLKPGRDRINLAVVESSEKGNWTLVVNAVSQPITKSAIAEEIESTDCLTVKK